MTQTKTTAFSTTTQSFSLEEQGDNAHVIYSARNLLKEIGFNEVNQYLIASAISELSTNILRYTSKGSITMLTIEDGEGRQGIEVIAEDQGPGIEDITAAMREHYSSGQGLGLGLPSVKRIMDEFEIQSVPGTGTWIRVRKWLP